MSCSCFTRRAFLAALGAATLGVGAGACGGLGPGGAPAPRSRRRRPNIVLIMVDDMGFSDLGCFGGEIDTPNLDRLARDGMRMTHFYNNAMCVPTRGSLLTGLYPQAIRVGDPGEEEKTNCVTVGEALQAAGYRTLMAGKWHRPGMPVQRGFDRHFGLLDGACNFWNPGHAREGEAEPARKHPWQEHRWAVEDRVYKPYTPPEKDFYTTDAFTDYALDRLDEYQGESKPFFLYMAYNAPHYPMQAWPEDIEKYRGRYLEGWETVRRRRYERMVEMGLVDERWPMSPRDPEVPDWDGVEDKDAWDLKMAVYAAMIDRVDQNVGRLLERIRDMGEEDDTLVIFLSDNGASAESFHVNPDVPPGPLEGFHTVDRPWGNVSNTPFRRFKFSNHEGGVSAPFIARWPGVIEAGAISHEVGHVMDFMPTFLDAAKTQYPNDYEGREALPLEGSSLTPIFRGEGREGYDALFWRFSKNRAVRSGKWKLVSFHKGPWRLYDMEADRTELHDLAGAHPDLVRDLGELWRAWARRVGAED